MVDYYKFGCDFYYLHYDMHDGLHGTIYRHYSDTHNIEYIHGSNDKQIITLDDAARKKIFLDDLTKLKTCLKSIDKIPINGHNYLNMYDYNSCDYEKYYKKLSLAYLCNDDNICSLVDIDMTEQIINIGAFFTFIETIKFKMNDTYVINKKCRNKTNQKEAKLFFDYLTDEPVSATKSKFTGGMSSYPGITEVITEQKFIYYETLDYYQENPQNNLMPVIIEYDIDKGQFIIVDGNHRVAYHIKNKFEYIPVIIIFKNLTIDI